MNKLRNCILVFIMAVVNFGWVTAIDAEDWNHYLKPGGSIQPPQAETSSKPEVAQQGSGKVHYEEGLLRIGINERGTVDQVEVVKKVGFGLDEKAVEQVKTWKFRPAMRNGQPVPVQVNVAIKYKLYGHAGQ